MQVVMLVTALALMLCRCRSNALSFTDTRDYSVQVDLPNAIVDKHDKDPITTFQVVYPTNGAMETVPIEFRTEVGVHSIEEYKRHYGDKFLCVELDGELKVEACSPLMEPSVVFDTLPIGNYTARAFITDRDKSFRYQETSDTTFSIVSEDKLAALMDTKLPKEINLLEWAMKRQKGLEPQLQQGIRVDNRGNLVNLTTSNALLVIGVKTAVVENFQFRQAIRQTWASPDVLLHDVKVFFVGCVPDLSNVRSSQERHRIQKAIDLEKQTYGDLLTDELSCEDSYPDLPNKVKEFLHFTTQTFPQTPFVMVTDDDIYLRADRLVDELRRGDRSQRMYIGQVWGTLFGRSQTPVREATGRYYIPEDRYPLHTYPPFAFGPHYLLSMDCARFIAKNSDKLRGFGAMDDVSVALWLLLMQVHVNHTSAFSSLRIKPCKNKLLSLADLSPFGIRSIHTNLDEKRDFCYGFDEVTWRKSKNASDIETLSLQSSSTPLVEIQTYVHDLEDTEYLFVTSIISTEHNAGVKVSYYPSSETFRSYSRRVCLEARTLLKHSALKSWMCGGITLNLRDQVQKQFQIVERKGSMDHAFLELWRYNLFVSDEDALPLSLRIQLSLHMHRLRLSAFSKPYSRTTNVRF